MQNNLPALTFEQADLLQALATSDDQQLDTLTFGVIGFGRDGQVKRYNQFECKATGLRQDYVLGKHVFTQIAQCMNNFMVAQQFEDAWAGARPLDVTMDYVLTWRMTPTNVKLRLLWDAASDLSYIVLTWRTPVKT